MYLQSDREFEKKKIKKDKKNKRTNKKIKNKKIHINKIKLKTNWFWTEKKGPEHRQHNIAIKIQG